jgi:hypothetical protein
MLAVRIVVFLLGVAAALAVLMSAIRTVVLPRAQRVKLSRAVFLSVRSVFDLRLKLAQTYEDRDRALALYGPLCLILLPAAWMAITVGAFTAMFWALGIGSWHRAFAASGSSVTTLGFEAPVDVATDILAVVEAVIGLGLIALMISYLPSIYGSFQRRELAVNLLEVRAGTPPSAETLIIRHHRIGLHDRSDVLFRDWEIWFADIEETHTSHPALVYFRSPLPGRSWITAAGATLDAAALMASTVEGTNTPEAQLCLRAGFLALRKIADFYGIPHDPNPGPDDPISIHRSEWEETVDRLVAEGVAVKADREQAWRDFAGWRVNYDQVLLALATLVVAPYARWSSDRSARTVGGRFGRIRPLRGN